MTFAFRRILLLLGACSLIHSPAQAGGDMDTRKEILSALTFPTNVILYSLNPEPKIFSRGVKSGDGNHTLHNVRVLGFTFLDKKDFKTATDSVEEAVTKWQGDTSACMDFQFHHALRVSSRGKTYDFMICYECGSLVIYKGRNAVADINLYNKSPALDKLLTTARIPTVKLPILPEDLSFLHTLLAPDSVTEYSLGQTAARMFKGPSFHSFPILESRSITSKTFHPFARAIIDAWHNWDGVWSTRLFQPTRGLHLSSSSGAYDILFDFNTHRMTEISNDVEVCYPGIGITTGNDEEKNLQKLFSLTAADLKGN